MKTHRKKLLAAHRPPPSAAVAVAPSPATERAPPARAAATAPPAAAAAAAATAAASGAPQASPGAVEAFAVRKQTERIQTEKENVFVVKRFCYSCSFPRCSGHFVRKIPLSRMKNLYLENKQKTKPYRKNDIKPYKTT